MTDLDQAYSGTTEVRPQHRFEVAPLDAWMRATVEGYSGPLTVTQFKGGQSNPTYLLETPGRRYVLRRKPPGELLPSAHAVDREYRIMKALAGSGVPVARMHGLCDDASVIGSTFFVMDHVAGRIFWNQALPGLDPVERGRIYDAMNQVIARLHTVDYAAIGLADYGRPGNYFARQIGRWTKQYRASETERIEAMERLIEWLPANIPPGDETTLVHGDYRIDNMIFHPFEPRILAVLDWELSTLGHPLGDFAYHCMSWRLGPLTGRGLAQENLTELGIPTEAAYVADYCKRTGRAGIENWDFYMAFNMFRLAGILQGIVGRALAGTAANPDAMEQGKRVRPLAEMGWGIVGKGM